MYQDHINAAGVGAARPASRVPFIELLAPAAYIGEAIVSGFTMSGRALHRSAQAYRRRRAVNATIRDLSRLSDRSLADIGIQRDMIPTVAEQVVAGNQAYRSAR